jgi:hypothetical protein
MPPHQAEDDCGVSICWQPGHRPRWASRRQTSPGVWVSNPSPDQGYVWFPWTQAHSVCISFVVGGFGSSSVGSKGTCGFPEPKLIRFASHLLLEDLGHHPLGSRERHVRGVRNKCMNLNPPISDRDLVRTSLFLAFFPKFPFPITWLLTETASFTNIYLFVYVKVLHHPLTYIMIFTRLYN